MLQETVVRASGVLHRLMHAPHARAHVLSRAIHARRCSVLLPQLSQTNLATVVSADHASTFALIEICWLAQVHPGLPRQSWLHVSTHATRRAAPCTAPQGGCCRHRTWAGCSRDPPSCSSATPVNGTSRALRNAPLASSVDRAKRGLHRCCFLFAALSVWRLQPIWSSLSRSLRRHLRVSGQLAEVLPCLSRGSCECKCVHAFHGRRVDRPRQSAGRSRLCCFFCACCFLWMGCCALLWNTGQAST